MSNDPQIGFRRTLMMAASTLAATCAVAMPAHAQLQGEAQPPSTLPQPAPTAADQASATEAEADAEAQDTSEIVVSGRFLDSGAGSATKMDLSVLDTPFSTAAYTGDFMKAVEATNVSDLYRYMTGVQRAGNTGYDITFRGFKTSGNDRNAILTDGLPGLSVRFGSPPTVGVDHIELVKGPTSVLYGQGQPGGFINVISKKPRSKSALEFGLRYHKGIGDFDRANGGHASIDATGPIDSNGTFLYRLVAEIGDTESFRDFSFEQAVYVAPGLTINLSDRTTLTFLGEYRRVRTKFEGNLVAPFRDVALIADIDTSYQTNQDYLYEDGAIGSVFLAHEFSSDVKLNVGYRYVDHYDFSSGFDNAAIRADGVTLQRRARQTTNYRTYSFLDANMTAKFDTFGLRHQLLVGVNVGSETFDSSRQRFFNGTATGANALDVNIYNPVYTNRLIDSYPVGTLQSRDTTQKSFGFYASNLVTIAEWLKVMGGVRYADEKQSVTDVLVTPNPTTRAANKKWLPLGGVIVQPTANLSIYASYSSSFVPVSATTQDIFGQFTFTPTQASSIEGGVKTELLDRKLNLTAAVFEITRTDVISTFACNTVPTATATGNCARQVGEDRSTGFELEGNAQPLDGLQIIAGYAYTNARITKSDLPAQIGARATNSPRHTANVWVRYDFQPDSALENFGIGGGISYIGDRVGLLPTTGILPTGVKAANINLPLPGYTTVDLGLYWSPIENIDITLKISNLFDKRYIESAGFTGDLQILPGAPRNAALSARVKF